MNRLVHIFHRLFDNPTQYARHLGVKIGAHSTKVGIRREFNYSKNEGYKYFVRGKMSILEYA